MDFIARARLTPHHQFAVDLLDEAGDELQTQGRTLRNIQSGGQPDPIIADTQGTAPGRRSAAGDRYGALSSGRKSMLETIGDELVDNQPAGKGRVDIQRYVVCLNLKGDSI